MRTSRQGGDFLVSLRMTDPCPAAKVCGIFSDKTLLRLLYMCVDTRSCAGNRNCSSSIAPSNTMKVSQQRESFLACVNLISRCPVSLTIGTCHQVLVYLFGVSGLRLWVSTAIIQTLLSDNGVQLTFPEHHQLPTPGPGFDTSAYFVLLEVSCDLHIYLKAYIESLSSSRSILYVVFSFYLYQVLEDKTEFIGSIKVSSPFQMAKSSEGEGSIVAGGRRHQKSLDGQLTFILAADMKAQCLSCWLLGMALILCSVHTRSLRRCLISVDMRLIEKSFQEIKRTLVSMGCLKEWQTKDTFQNVTILSTLENLRSIKCCDKVDLVLALLMPTIWLTTDAEGAEARQVRSQCHCSQEATNATRIIHDNYNQLDVSSAALKSLGELDIVLTWIDQNHQETSAV
ncbi:hypothetical protein STEG23_034197 [Scotinomys teguina]